MTEPIKAYPLQWPQGWKRTDARYRKSANFRTGGGKYRTSAPRSLSVADGCTRVRKELEMMGVPDYMTVVSSNLLLRNDGCPRSGQPEPEDPGVAVYWRDLNEERRCMAIDRYTRAADNLAAIAATLEAMRAIERHGGAEILDRAFTGFVALPGPSEHWADVLGFTRGAVATHDDVEAAYRKLRSQHHPDRGGDPEQFRRVQQAFEQFEASHK